MNFSIITQVIVTMIVLNLYVTKIGQSQKLVLNDIQEHTKHIYSMIPFESSLKTENVTHKM